ncbi:MAG: putative Ni/Fe-hydrogenase 2 b-type cytochrome subunit [Phycisphaerae bacterium]|nr:putative Ni/Fe-hydrogenase 2 b-type cytochrome subunit [Phycisphaerae bacterium]
MNSISVNPVHTEHHTPLPAHRPLLTPGVWVLLFLMVIGAAFYFYRFIFGLKSVTHLDQQHPWGLWIAVDVATGVALAAGGFTTSALAHIFHREHYHAITRPALLTAMLGYTFVVLGLLADLGRYYNIWHPLWPTMWQGNSVLFEVGICVTIYLNVLYIEFMPIFCERFIGSQRYPRLAQLCGFLYRHLNQVMWLFIIAGVVLSSLHQSSLGNLMVIAPSKMHPLWYTPILSLLFLLSAVMVGFPMVIFESIYASWSLGIKAEVEILGPLSRYIPITAGLYLAFKMGDLVMRNSYVHLWPMDGPVVMFLLEMALPAIALVMLLSNRHRHNARWLFIAALLVVLSVVLNRVNVFLIAYQPPYATKAYVPAFGEFAVTIGLIAALIFCYRVIVNYFPVITHPELSRRS